MRLARFKPNPNRCAHCKQYFHPKHRDCKYCSDKCKQGSWSKLRSERRNRAPIPKPSLEGSAPTCPKHPDTALAFGSHPLTGVSLEFCPACRETRLLPIRGKRTYPQRQDLDTDVDRKIATAKSPPKPVSPKVGDAWRQETRKRGKNFTVGKGHGANWKEVA